MSGEAGLVDRSGLVGGFRLFGGSGTIGRTGLSGEAGLEDGSGLVGGSRLFGGSGTIGRSGLSEEAGLVDRLGLVGGSRLVGVSGSPSDFFRKFLVLLLVLLLFLPEVPASPPVFLPDCLVLLLIRLEEEMRGSTQVMVLEGTEPYTM